MEHEYSWEATSSYEPPRSEGYGWAILVAVVVALLAHVALLVWGWDHFIKFEVAESQEWVSEPVRLSENDVQTEPLEVAEEPAEEDLERPEIEGELLDSTEDAIADLKDTDIDIDTKIEEATLPEMKIEKPLLKGEEDGDLPEPVIAPNASAEDLPLGSTQDLFVNVKDGQLIIDDGSPLSSDLDPNSIIKELGKMKGAGGDSHTGSIKGYTGLSAYAKMSPGDLLKNKASIGSDLLFAFNESTLRDDARLTLMTVAMLIDRNPNMYCWVEGHTDTIGGEEFNEKLSAKRGKAVKDWLVNALQLDPKRIIVRPFGMNQPIVKEGDKDQQAPNRRVDIKMRKTQPGAIERPQKMLVKPGKAVVVPDDEDEKKPSTQVEIVEEEDDDDKIPEALPITE